MTEVTRMEPPVLEEGAAFWAATEQRELVLPWCTECEQPFWYPRPACPRCLGTNISWRAASGQGEIYAVTVVHRAQNPLRAARAPYAVALVDLAEGVRMMTNIVGLDADRVRVGMPVQVTWEALSDGRHLPLFQPTADAVSEAVSAGVSAA